VIHILVLPRGRTYDRPCFESIQAGASRAPRSSSRAAVTWLCRTRARAAGRRPGPSHPAVTYSRRWTIVIPPLRATGRPSPSRLRACSRTTGSTASRAACSGPHSPSRPRTADSTCAPTVRSSTHPTPTGSASTASPTARRSAMRPPHPPKSWSRCSRWMTRRASSPARMCRWTSARASRRWAAGRGTSSRGRPTNPANRW